MGYRTVKDGPKALTDMVAPIVTLTAAIHDGPGGHGGLAVMAASADTWWL